MPLLWQTREVSLAVISDNKFAVLIPGGDRCAEGQRFTILCKRHQDAITHAGSKAGAHHGPSGRRHNLRRVGDVGILRQRFGIQCDGVMAIRGHERHDGIATEVSLHACLVGDMGAVRTGAFTSAMVSPSGWLRVIPLAWATTPPCKPTFRVC